MKNFHLYLAFFNYIYANSKTKRYAIFEIEDIHGKLFEEYTVFKNEIFALQLDLEEELAIIGLI